MRYSGMKTYVLEVKTEHSIPPDVLIEHTTVALKQLQYAGFISIALRGTGTQKASMARNHPFEGPEVFDDYIPASPTDVGARELLDEIDPYPLITEALNELGRRVGRHGSTE